MSEWQPIKTAPLGVPALYSFADGEMMVAVKETASYRNSGFRYGIVGVGGYEWDCTADFEDPTHWQPLPDPPK